MPVTRMRMRPWLESKIDSNSISGLAWVDKEKKMFSIPWKHAARHGWEMEKDACLFKQWAIHTGKFRQDETEPDPKTWKANFRCAMNSLPDIEEVKDRSVNRGCGAVRVYRMLHFTAKTKDKKSKVKESKRRRKVKTEGMENSDSTSSEQTCSSPQKYEDRTTQESTVDSTDHLGLCDYMSESEVPDYATSIDVVCADSTSQRYAFQVSPDHSPVYDMDAEAIIEITQQLEQDHTQWPQGKGILTNDLCRSDSYPSPASQWSNNSGEELELRLYTELSPGLSTTDELVGYNDYWNCNTSYTQQISCLF
ncbi:interferon regulatory factor 1b isoform X1 [Osmerus mordax]|uniref:interferon regulatory factor 1b isoform X1 n=2 Tax=Osmerus mordax TaxID=8014 RepID=UPI00350FEA77